MTGAAEIEVREARKGDLDAVLELLGAALGPGSVPRTERFWQWKHRANPFGASPAWVAVARGRIVGLRTFLRWRWALEGRRVDAVRAVDTATHPDWQRQGIFWRLTREALERLAEGGAEFVFNTPNRRSGAGYRKLGWRPALRPPMFVRAVKPLRMAGAVLRGKRAPADLGALPGVEELLGWPDFDDLVADCGRAWRSRLHTPRDRRYLQWRYAEIPGVDYRSLWATDGDSALAMIFRTRLRRSMRELLISELLGRGTLKARRRLFAGLLARLREESDVDYLVATAPARSPEASLLEAAKFLRAPAGPSLMVRSLTPSRQGDARLASDCWQLAIGDLEIF